MDVVEELADPTVPIATACEALGVSRATLYRNTRPPAPPAVTERAPSPRRLSDAERAGVLAALHSTPRSPHGILMLAVSNSLTRSAAKKLWHHVFLAFPLIATIAGCDHGVTVHGGVVRADGTPVASANVVVSCAWGSYKADTDIDGHYRTRGIGGTQPSCAVTAWLDGQLTYASPASGTCNASVWSAYGLGCNDLTHDIVLPATAPAP